MSTMSGAKNVAQESYQLRQSRLHLCEGFSQVLLCETDTGHFYDDCDQTSIDHLLQKLILFPLP
jgi:hypothetical protein